MGNYLYVTQFGTFAMPFHTGNNYRIVVVDLQHNRVSYALMPDTIDSDGLPSYAPTFDSYNEAIEWLDLNHQNLF